MKIFKTTWQHMRRSPYQAIAAILAMVLTFLLTGFFFLTTVTSAIILQYFEGKPQITVFFKDTVDQKLASELTQTLETTGKTASITFISKNDALATYRNLFQKDPLLLEMVTADILPASLEVSATDPKYLQELADTINTFEKKSPVIEEVVYQKDVVDALIKWTNAIRLVGGVLAGLLALDAVLIVMTVIGMKIALRKDEIEILTLVGASVWYIRFPFLWEGVVYGVSGAFVAWGIITSCIVWLRPTLFSFLESIPLFHEVLGSPTSMVFLGSSGAFLAVLLVIGFFLGAVGSMVAVGRYLKF